MKKGTYLLAVAALAVSTACSKIDANTSNSVPTSDAYAASVTANQAAPAAATPADAVVRSGGTPGSMMYDNRVVTEASFLVEAASSGNMEIQLARLALDRAAHPEVKTFAQMLIDHHSKAGQEITSLASGMNVSLPNQLLPDHQKLVDKLSKLTGSEFDKKYVDETEGAHEKAIALYEVISNSAPTTSIRAFAIRALPVLRQHEHQANALDDKVER